MGRRLWRCGGGIRSGCTIDKLIGCFPHTQDWEKEKGDGWFGKGFVRGILQTKGRVFFRTLEAPRDT